MNQKEKGQLTVRELIEQLQKMPQDVLVWHEGCDCFGAANGVIFEPGNEKDETIPSYAVKLDSVLITRA
jgi:hypothetical protein